jgi:hypothetical protein
VNASSPRPPAPHDTLRKAGHLGRRHGRAAVYWQIGTSTGRDFYRDLLRGITTADPAVTGLYEIPDLTARWDYDRASLAADLQLADDGPALAPGRRGLPGRRPRGILARSRPPGPPAPDPHRRRRDRGRGRRRHRA